jgi:uncharacterized caspase-like protein
MGVSAQEKRYALVVGNGNYADLAELKNPVNDATDMAAALRDVGFAVELLTNADLPTMENAVVRLGNRLSEGAGSIGFFFYAGHGVQSRWMPGSPEKPFSRQRRWRRRVCWTPCRTPATA